MQDLKEKTIRGGFARLCAQAANFMLRIGSLMVLARLLGPKDFGLVGMVTAFTGVLTLFRDFGLSSAAIQLASVTEEQISTLFWINVVVGAALTCLSAALAPFIAAFYHEPRLVHVTIALAAGFLLNAVGIQHSVQLQRQMHFTALAVINTTALIVSTIVGIVGAKIGYGYWALVGMTLAFPLVNTLGLWLTTRWVPGLPRSGSGIRSMIQFGGTLTLNGLIVYIATNFEKVLLGRFWGVDAIGLYGRAYQLISIPTDNLNSAAGEVAFAALSRLQHDPLRLKSYFLKGYSLVLALTLPLTLACALFADDMILVFLGPKWKEAAPIFRLLAPTILVFAIANPLSWLLSSIGLVKRLLNMGLVIAPVMIVGYLLGLPYGPKGVATSYSVVMTLWLIPLVIWALHGTMISPRDIVSTLIRPLGSSIVAGVIAFGVKMTLGAALSPLPRLTLESSTLLVLYLGLLLFVAGQKALYIDLLRGFKKPLDKKESLAPVCP